MSISKDIGVAALSVGALAVAAKVGYHYGARYFKRKAAERTVDQISGGLEKISSRELTEYLTKIQNAIPNLKGDKQTYAKQLQETIENRLTTSSDDQPTEVQKVIPIQDFYSKNGTHDE